MHSQRIHVVIVSAIVAALSLAWSAPARANHEILTCNDICATDCTGLGSNCRTAESGSCLLSPGPSGVLVCAAGEGPILLKNGTDLDMHGKTLQCADGVDCGDGITMDAAGSRVYNGVSNSEAVITGGFLSAVNCAALNNSEVVGIKISKSIVGVRDCRRILNNVIRDLGRTFWAANWGIITVGVTETGDLIQGNYIEGRGFGIQIDGTKKPTVEDNVVHTTHFGACGIRLLNSGSQAKVLNNTILGTGNPGFIGQEEIVCLPSPAPTAAQFAGNVCDEDHPNCATCGQTVVNGGTLCVPMTAPFLP